MKSADEIKKFFSNAAIGTDPGMDETVLEKVLTAHEKATNTKSAVMTPNIRRTIMKSPITKLAAAAVIIVGVLIGMTQFGDPTTSVAWSQVAQKIQASRGVVLRCTETVSGQISEGDYTIKYLTPTHSRSDTYKGGQLDCSFYTNQDTKTFTGLFHPHKHYLIDTFSEIEGFLEKHEDWMNPGYLIETILSCEHSKLAPKMIEGVMCEGVETTDPAFLGPLPEEVDRLETWLRLWVDVETQYPVLVEYKTSAEHNGQVMGREGIMDNFQWDVDLDPSLLEPNIPPDYKDMRTL
jgi:hypothetical protein